MWKVTFEDRLAEWVELRTSDPNEALVDYLSRVNEWWHQTPWSPYYLHWDDVNEWPTPWELLIDDIYCPISRGLGMLYTIALSGREDTKDTVLIECGDDTVVVIGKYTLNYDQHQVVNTTLPTNARHILTVGDVLKRI